jgi:hypothetical protein
MCLSVYLLAKYLKKFPRDFDQIGARIPYHPRINPLTFGGQRLKVMVAVESQIFDPMQI